MQLFRKLYQILWLKKNNVWFKTHQSPGSHAVTSFTIETTSSFHGYWGNHLVNSGMNERALLCSIQKNAWASHVCSWQCLQDRQTPLVGNSKGLIWPFHRFTQTQGSWRPLPPLATPSAGICEWLGHTIPVVGTLFGSGATLTLKVDGQGQHPMHALKHIQKIIIIIKLNVVITNSLIMTFQHKDVENILK